MGETWAQQNPTNSNVLKSMVGAVGIEPTTAPVWRERSSAELKVWPIRAMMPSGVHVSCSPSLRQKVIDVSRRFSKSALSL